MQKQSSDVAWRLGYTVIWLPPLLAAFLVALFINAGDKQPLVVMAASVLAMPYLVAAILAWRKWPSPLRSLLAGVASAISAYALLVAVAMLTVG